MATKKRKRRTYGTGGLTKVRDGVWRAHVRDQTGSRHTRTIHADSAEDAQQQLDRFRNQIAGGEISNATYTVADLLDAWLKSRTDLAAASRYTYRRNIESHVLPRLGTVRIAQVTTYMLDGAYRKMPPTAALTAHLIMRQAFDQAEAWGWVTRNPADKARPPRQNRKREKRQPPTPDQTAAILAHYADDRALVLRLAAATGARRGELCALRWSHYNHDTGKLTIDATLTRTDGGGFELAERTKTGQTRTITLDPDTVALLNAHRRRRLEKMLAIKGGTKLPRQHIFTKDEGATPINPRTLDHWFRQAADAVGYPGRLHDLRHFHATQLLGDGIDIPAVAARLGHAKSNTTLSTYAHAIPARDEAAAASIGKRLRPAQ